MPLYLTNSKLGLLDDAAKQKIASDITATHCEVTGGPSIFVHAFFVHDAPDIPLGDKSVVTVGAIRAGRTDGQKATIKGRIREAISRHVGMAEEDVLVEIRDTPASWSMEGGEIMPEPGEEAAWLAAHGHEAGQRVS